MMCANGLGRRLRLRQRGLRIQRITMRSTEEICLTQPQSRAVSDANCAVHFGVLSRRPQDWHAVCDLGSREATGKVNCTLHLQIVQTKIKVATVAGKKQKNIPSTHHETPEIRCGAEVCVLANGQFASKVRTTSPPSCTNKVELNGFTLNLMIHVSL